MKIQQIIPLNAYLLVLCLWIGCLEVSAQESQDSLSHILCPQDTVPVQEIVEEDFPANTNFFSQIKPKQFALPLLLISYVVGVDHIDALKRFDRDRKKDIEKYLPSGSRIDDALIFVPAASVFALDWCGVEARHSFKDRVIVSGTSMILGIGASEITKRAIGRLRPDGSEFDSFPSGHTTMAFLGAHLLMKEYGHHSPLISIGGYTVATSVAFLRMVNNRHWFSDVVVGAGYGMLSVEVSYLLLPYLSKTLTFGKSPHNRLTLSPAGGYGWAGVNASLQF